jgi:hypothetical protein
LSKAVLNQAADIVRRAAVIFCPVFRDSFGFDASNSILEELSTMQLDTKFSMLHWGFTVL